MSEDENKNIKDNIKLEKSQKRQTRPQLPKHRDLRDRCNEIFSKDIPQINNKDKKKK